MNSLPSGPQLVNAIPEIVCFRSAQPVTHFSKPLHAYNALVLYFCRLCVEPLEERNRTVVFYEQDHFCFRQALSPSIALLRFFGCPSIALLRLSINGQQSTEPDGLIVHRDENSHVDPRSAEKPQGKLGIGAGMQLLGQFEAGRWVLRRAGPVSRIQGLVPWENQSNSTSPPPT